MIKVIYTDHSLNIDVDKELCVVIDQIYAGRFMDGIQSNTMNDDINSKIMRECQIIYDSLSKIDCYLKLIQIENGDIK